MEIIGIENFQEKGGIVLASNHLSYLDPIILGAAAPRPIYFLAKHTLFKGFFLKSFLLSCNAFPVNREGTDIHAIRKSIQLLKDGSVVTIFPEGTRSQDGKLKKVKEGVALLAVKSQSKILPARIYGSDKCLPKGSKFIRPAKLTVKFGTPIDCSVYMNVKDKNLYSDISEKVIEEIRNL